MGAMQAFGNPRLETTYFNSSSKFYFQQNTTIKQ